MSIWQIMGGAFFILYAVSVFWTGIPAFIMGIVALIAGVALLAGK